ncbi:MAG: DOMON-like domain-containing protein [Alphaproteobacteria bacterium]|nr:DOMON-like domain-containing protein [Alphaproteobacteria bacterium]
MRHPLRLHPDSTCDAIKRVDVEVERVGETELRLRYIAVGKVADLLLAPPARPERKDELWRTTCFELFVQEPPHTAYREFNFAPSTQWAAYRFTGYREGMMPATEIAAPRIDAQSHAGTFELRASLEVPNLRNATRLAISAVIEETNGRKSYWALAHPPGKPDFHHAVGFALDLANETPK